MSDEPGRKVMLFFLELMMVSKRTFTISQLVGRFGNAFFTPEMRLAAGVNSKGLRQFLLRYPSLFTITGDVVSLCGPEEPLDDTGKHSCCSESLSEIGYCVHDLAHRRPSGPTVNHPVPDTAPESEAVQFLRNCIAKRRQKWVPIRCLTGHFSQMTRAMRAAIGQPEDLKAFLQQQTRVFEVNDDSVGLRQRLGDPVCTPEVIHDSRHEDSASSSSQSPSRCTETQTLTSRADVSPSSPNSARTIAERFPEIGAVFNDQLSAFQLFNSPVTMTIVEYRAVMFLKSILEMTGSINTTELLEFTEEKAPTTVRTLISSSRAGLENFLQKHATLFEFISEDRVALAKNAKLCVIVTGNNASSLSENQCETLDKCNNELLSLKPTLLQRSQKSLVDERSTPDRELPRRQSKTKKEVPPENLQTALDSTGSLFGVPKADTSFTCLFNPREFKASRRKVSSSKTFSSVECQTLSTGEITASRLYLGE